MIINKHNYEEYLLDFLEGTLSQELVGEVRTFLKQNPDIKNEAEELLDSALEIESYSFSNKEILKKSLDYDIEGISRFEQLSVAQLEGDITIDEAKQLNRLLGSSKLKRDEHEIIQKCVVDASESIVFPGKNKLKRLLLLPKRTKFYYLTTSIAAIIALLIGFIVFFRNFKEEPGLALNDNFSLNYSGRQVSQNEKIKANLENVEVSIFKSETKPKDVVEESRLTSAIASIDSKSIRQVNLFNGSDQINAQLLKSITISTVENNYKTESENIEEYVSKKLEELEVKNNKETFSVASMGRSLLQWITNTLKKKVQIKKETIEDGRKLYAVRTGSFEFYTSLKGKKNKNKLPEEDTYLDE